jgi:hypothetical protein
MLDGTLYFRVACHTPHEFARSAQPRLVEQEEVHLITRRSPLEPDLMNPILMIPAMQEKQQNEDGGEEVLYAFEYARFFSFPSPSSLQL